ncbi:MAG: undecaprenyl/decaprenyl-phosphate alpha-N-acetylglucosaminyl 1-phosphate transferase [Anaerolineales bacterium]|nr:undecaprenyl/decaprenyl-phosphate alpha-N-acetylglucosaminyl 1-phosphate transferase [Anaerolineales bacterium]
MLTALQSYWPIIVAAALLAFLATPLTRLLAHRLGMVDQPGLRKTHRLPVPLLGGLAMYSALAAAFLLFGQPDWRAEGVGIFGGATLLFLTGLWDDRFGLPAWFKLAAQIVAAFAVMVVGIQVQLAGLKALDWLITLLWIVGITNAVNLMDNMDGLAAGIALVAALAFFLLAALEGQGLVAGLAAALAGAAAGFLFYNVAPAISFMGDAGALTLGFLLAVIGLKLRFTHYPLGSTWMAPIIVLGVLIFDTALVCVSRLRRGRSIFQGGSDHTSHRLAQLGLSQPRAVLTLYVSAAGLGLAALFITRAPVMPANAAFGALLAAGVVALIVFERIEPRLSGDPALVLLPGGGGLVEAVRAASRLSREVVLLLAPAYGPGGDVRPARQEVIDALAALAEDPAAVRRLLERGLGEAWWEDLNSLNRAFRLNGTVWLVLAEPAPALPGPSAAYTLPGAVQPPVSAALTKARLILLGPGDPAVNVAAALAAPGVRAGVLGTRGAYLWVGAAGAQAEAAAWLGHSVPAATPARWESEVQAQLLQQAARQAKSRAGAPT